MPPTLQRHDDGYSMYLDPCLADPFLNFDPGSVRSAPCWTRFASPVTRRDELQPRSVYRAPPFRYGAAASINQTGRHSRQKTLALRLNHPSGCQTCCLRAKRCDVDWLHAAWQPSVAADIRMARDAADKLRCSAGPKLVTVTGNISSFHRLGSAEL